jgi:RNA-directed DNA polymerase
MGQPIERNHEHGQETRPVRWEDTDWPMVEARVRRIQERIFRATRAKHVAEVCNLQHMLAKSYFAWLLAVKRVTQENSGRLTPGIDGLGYLDSKAREGLVDELRSVNVENWRGQPALRVYIPKPGKDEKRPLGIPTMKDRVVQMVVKFALEAEWEAKFEPNSYGFRPGRRAMDAVMHIRECIREVKGQNRSAWVLDTDITKCFDNIDHAALLRKVGVFKGVIQRWLEAGVIDFGYFRKTPAGTPQGGVISRATRCYWCECRT